MADKELFDYAKHMLERLEAYRDLVGSNHMLAAKIHADISLAKAILENRDLTNPNQPIEE